MKNIKSRIVEHVKIRAGDLVPHELNPRKHSDDQREALAGLYDEIGFARSVLAYRLPDGRLKLIDGHLRRSMDPEMVVEVEVLDVNDDEARKLLLSIDPLAALADYDDKCLNELRSVTKSDSNTLTALWAGLTAKDKEITDTIKQNNKKPQEAVPESYLVMIECETEKDQITLLRRFKKEGLTCKAMTT